MKYTPVEYVKEFSVCTQQFFNYTPLGFVLRSRYQWYPLQIIGDQGNFELYKYVFEKTKNTREGIEHIWTGLHMVAKRGHEEICEFIIENSDEKNPSDLNDGMTPLHYAAERGLANVCKLIIENVDNKNPAALNGCTPLHLAAKNGHLQIARLIVNTGVDKNSLFHGKTPLDLVYQSHFRSFTFYKLLSKDKFQLCGLIFEDLRLCLIILFFLCVLFYLVMMLILTIVGLCIIDFPDIYHHFAYHLRAHI